MRTFLARLRAGRLRLTAAVVVGVLALALSGTALAVHDETFELDGNLNKADSAGTGDVDWNDDIVGVGATGFSTAKASLPAGFSAATAGPDFTTTTRRGVEVPETADTSTFTTNSKDVLDIGAQWRCVKANNVTDKGDLVNTYGAAYVNAANELILYFGAEKNDASGTNDLGVWFLQDSTVDCTDTQGGNGTAFTGSHRVGDVLVVSEFTGGGSTATITAYKWDPGAPTAVNNLVKLGDSGICGAPGTDDRLCAVTNVSNQMTPPWKTWDKDTGRLNLIDTQQFYEGAINVSAFGLSPCVSTLLTDTRSSVSTTATLYDYARRPFSVCGANIQIGPDDVNEIGQNHTFTVTVNRSIGGASTPIAGVKPTVTLSDANGAVSTISANTCATTGTDSNGQCTVTFTSNTPGTVTGHAAADVSVGGTASTHVETSGQGSNSGDAGKRFVDARIAIRPNDTNSIGESHTFTVNVEQNDGLAANQGVGDAVSGFGPAPNGTNATVTLTGSPVDVVNTCGGIGTVNGSCSVTFTSNVAGTVVGHASTTFSVGGVSLTRQTSGVSGNSGDATKVFVSGSIAWTKVDNAGSLQGGAKFEVCRTHNLDTSTDPDTFVDIDPDVCVTVVDDVDGVAGGTLDEDPDPGEFKVAGLRLGRYTVKETAAPPGFEPDPDTVTVELTLDDRNRTIATAFRNERSILKITGFGYTNEATGTPTGGVVSGNATYSVDLHNYGAAAAVLSDSSLVVDATDAGAGTLTCGADNDPAPFTRAITGTVTAGSSLGPITVACHYANMADGAVITAALNIKYKTNELERTASGSPATISFTVQSD